MAIDTTSPRSRRALLAAALGAGAATVASAIGRPLPARAADGATMLVGGEYVSTSVTKIDNATNQDVVLWGASEGGIGVKGTGGSLGTGVPGVGASGPGVQGDSASGNGVSGTSTSGTGVWARSDAASPAILGISHGANTGVQGYSGAAGTEPGALDKVGVYGSANQDSTAIGVRGNSASGHGVYGISASGTGVNGFSNSGTGVNGFSNSGTGVYLNGSYVATVDLRAATTTYRVLAWQKTWSTTATRTVGLVVVGTSGRPRVASTRSPC